MIEIEQKVLLPESLHIPGTSLGSRTICDKYYDDVNYSLTRKDWWLRERNGKWQLKRIAGDDRATDIYEELHDAAEILAALDISRTASITDALATAGITMFAEIITERTSYQWDSYTIDVDCVHIGSDTYKIAEIERIVEDESAVAQARVDLQETLTSLGLTTARPEGKLIRYVRLERPDHYRALCDAGVVRA